MVTFEPQASFTQVFQRDSAASIVDLMIQRRLLDRSQRDPRLFFGFLRFLDLGHLGRLGMPWLYPACRWCLAHRQGPAHQAQLAAGLVDSNFGRLDLGLDRNGSYRHIGWHRHHWLCRRRSGGVGATIGVWPGGTGLPGGITTATAAATAMAPSPANTGTSLLRAGGGAATTAGFTTGAVAGVAAGVTAGVAAGVTAEVAGLPPAAPGPTAGVAALVTIRAAFWAMDSAAATA